tara:strand:- start:1289 stop:2644 length:1356 start_codon:yes stop_codon:yes gene_type:complete
MNLVVVGTGYVGLVTGTCFAEMGNQVACVDVDQQKLDRITSGQLPIHEPGLDDLVAKNIASGRLTFTSDLTLAVKDVDVIFVAVGTPAGEDGNADLTHVLAVAEQIGNAINAPVVIAGKSTVPVGTAARVKATIQKVLNKRRMSVLFDVVSNPEFLREGSAISDFMYPDRIVVGTSEPRSQRVMAELYSAFAKKEDRIQFVGVRDAEMIKYAANAMLATKISFINEVAVMCDRLGIDVEHVRRGIGSDPRIGSSFIYPGCGYGGSCFPKDVAAMIKMAEDAGLKDTILSAVERRNEAQKQLLVHKIEDHFDGQLKGKRFALWGLAFKPGTNDVRCAPALTIARELVSLGAIVKVYDPAAMADAYCELGTDVVYAKSAYEATDHADALIVATEWREFKQPDFRRLRRDLVEGVVFDGRNIYNPELCRDYGLTYVGIGRSSVPLDAASWLQAS